jgi:hypothetical protein
VQKVKTEACDKPLLKALTLMSLIAWNALHPQEQLITSVGFTVVKGLYTVLLDFLWMVNRLVKLRETCVKLTQFSILMFFVSLLQQKGNASAIFSKFCV